MRARNGDSRYGAVSTALHRLTVAAVRAVPTAQHGELGSEGTVVRRDRDLARTL